MKQTRPIVMMAVAVVLAGAGPSRSVATNSQLDLCVAAGAGDIAGIRAAVEAGADLDATDFCGRALEAALVLGHQEAVKVLLELGASANFETELGMRLVEAAMYTDNQLEMLSTILDHAAELDLDAKNRFGSVPLQTAIGKGSIELVRLLLESRYPIDLGHIGGTSAIDAAVIQGSPDMLRLILSDERPYNVNATGDDGLAVLHRASILGRRDLLRVLLKHGRDLDLLARTRDGFLVSDLPVDEDVLSLLAEALEER